MFMIDENLAWLIQVHGMGGRKRNRTKLLNYYYARMIGVSNVILLSRVCFRGCFVKYFSFSVSSTECLRSSLQRL